VADQAAIEADNVQLGFTRITAPIAGRLGAVNAAVGDLVTTANGNGQTTPLVTITQMDPLQVSFSLPEDDLQLVQKALSVPEGAVVTLRHDGEPDPIGTGKLTFVDSSVDTASGTIAVRASVPNPDLKLWPGQYVGATLEAGMMPDMVSVPTVAVQPSQKGPFVYVVKPDDTVEMRPVTVALAVGADSGLSSGLKSGEKVVVEGQTRLKNGAAVSEGGTASGLPGGRPAKVAQKADGEAAR
jgi:multidrug efflux system membrane fusion protein